MENKILNREQFIQKWAKQLDGNDPAEFRRDVEAQMPPPTPPPPPPQTVYVVLYNYHRYDDYQIEIYGVYSTVEAANLAIHAARPNPEAREWPLQKLLEWQSTLEIEAFMLDGIPACRQIA